MTKHLTFTKSYWIDLCQHTLNQQIHHNPTKGGDSEREKFKNYYETSESLYKEKFGIFPPDDIWHHSQKRFSEIQFQRINLHRNWVIPKSTLKFLSQTLFFSCLPFIILQASPTKITLQTIILLIIFGLILYSASKNSTNKSNNSSGNSGCSSCVASYDSDGAESGCGGDSSCSGCGGCGGGGGGD